MRLDDKYKEYATPVYQANPSRISLPVQVALLSGGADD